MRQLWILASVLWVFTPSISLAHATKVFVHQADSLAPKSRDGLADLQSYIATQFNDPMFQHAHWGAHIQSLTTGKTWFELNAEKLFNPASNNKLPTGAMALDCLGADYKFKTQLFYTGDIVNGVLEGDLIIKGSGDPAIGGRFFERKSKEIFRQWASRLKEKGIQHIQGNIIGDDTLIGDEGYGKGWELEDMNYGYGAPISALNFEDNAIVFNAKVENNAVNLVPELSTSYFSFDNQLKTGDENKVEDYRIFNTEHFMFKGTVAETYKTTMSVQNPTAFFVHVLKETFAEYGITHSKAKAYDIEDLGTVSSHQRLLYTHESPPFSELLKVFEKESQNQYGEVFARIAGGVCNNPKQEPYTFAMGDSLMTQFWQEVGVAPKSYEYADGSGMSRYNWVSPKQLTTLLAFMDKHPQSAVFKAALPIAGVDGTLKSRMKNTAAAGNVLAKTGTISAIRSLSGYVKTADGEPLVFSFMVNGFLVPASQTNRITDAVLVKLAEFRSN